MTTIFAQVICDSISPDGIRLTTLQLRYPRFIHAEFMTHRVFSRNASSSRAIPVERLIRDVIDDPAVPLFWGGNQKGMQAGQELPDHGVCLPASAPSVMRVGRRDAWLYARDRAVEMAEMLADAGYHKQLVNRLLEPFSHINVVVTATEWRNFFALRRHDDAEPHIRLLADRIFEAMTKSKPKALKPGQWHLPYIEESRIKALARHAYPVMTRPTDSGFAQGIAFRNLIRVSVARCARVSYLTHDGKPSDVEEDLNLYQRLVGVYPMHASPAEHQATPDSQSRGWGWLQPGLHGNFIGWIQYRKTLLGESVQG